MDFCKAHRIDHHAVHHWLDNRREPGPRHWKWLAHFLEMGDSVDGMFTMCQEAAASRETERVAVEAWLVLHPMWKKRRSWRRKFLKKWRLGQVPVSASMDTDDAPDAI